MGSNMLAEYYRQVRTKTIDDETQTHGIGQDRDRNSNKRIPNPRRRHRLHRCSGGAAHDADQQVDRPSQSPQAR